MTFSFTASTGHRLPGACLPLSILGQVKPPGRCLLQALTPRQIRLLASAPDSHYDVSPLAAEEAVCNTAGPSTVREIDPPYMYSSRQSRRSAKQRMQK